MRIAGSNRFILNPAEKKTLARMAKDGSSPVDIEEGEISDGSVEEISKEDFKLESKTVEEISAEDFKQESRVSKPRADSRAWINYPSNYPQSGLYNLAWASAVQNKPLNVILARGFGNEASRSTKSPSLNTGPNSEKETDRVVIDVSGDDEDDMGEKEEGELEEGEIELDSDVVEIENCEEGNPPDNSNLSHNSEMQTGDSMFRKRISAISEDLETITAKDAENSFNGVCSKIRTTLESLRLMILENRTPEVDSLIQQTFTGIRAVHSVFGSSSLKQQEQYKEGLSRLFSLIKSQDPALFSPEKMKEIESMMQALVLKSSFSGTKAANKENETHASNDPGVLAENSGLGLLLSKKLPLEPISVNCVGGSTDKNGPVAMKLEVPFSSRGRGDFGLLIDPHVDYDEGSLPSPTRENPPPFPKQKMQGVSDVTTCLATAKQEETEDAASHPYETDALKAVSSYQQKFGRTSFLASNRLPSPTPSEECDDDDGDSHDEVSSSSAASNSMTANSSILLQAPVSTSVLMGGMSGQGLLPSKTVVSIGTPAVRNARTENSSIPFQAPVSTSALINGISGQVPVPVKTVAQMSPALDPILKHPMKSRDPRLRYANPDASALDLNRRPPFGENNATKNELLGGAISSKKHKVVEESVLDGHTLKRQRNCSADSGVSREVGMASARGGWLEDGSVLGSQPSEKERLPESMELDVRKPGDGEVSNKPQHVNANINATDVGSQQLPVTSAGSTVSLPSLLKDIAVNPTILMHLIKMEKERLAAEAQQKSADSGQPAVQISSSNVLPVAVSLVNAPPSKSREPDQRLTGRPQNPSQAPSMSSQSEPGKVRMKPRDPRRILHNMFQKTENLGSDQSKTNGPIPPNVQGRKDIITVREQGEQAVTSSLPQSASLPDIGQQLTNKLQNIAAILSSPQMTNGNTPPTITQAVNQPMASKADKADVRVPADSNLQQNLTNPIYEESSTGSPQPPIPWGDIEHLFEGYDDNQRAALQKERARRIVEQNKMFAARKLCLVLDLDHTLLNSAKFAEVEPTHEEILRKKEELDRDKRQRHLFRFPHMGMWTKLRPGIWNFLEKASRLYELHLYTMGNKFYATEMAKVLDPTGALFAGRVLSRGDDGDPFDGDERVPKSKDLDGVLGMESAVVIIDDSARVWPHNKLNLIVVERYTYFPCSRRQFGLVGPSLLEIDHDERPEDGTLASSLAVIERIHQNFFSHRSLNDVDVRNILAAEQRRILAGCRIVFSRIFPVGEANPHLHPLWQTAEQFGAVCTNQIDDQVTHVVANSLGTDKVNWALSTGRFVVHPGWVEASALLYRRANERDFAVKI